MFKKFAAILLTALILSCALFVPAFAAEGKYVFMDVNTGKDGSDGLTAETARRSLGSLDGSGCMAALGEEGGTMVISGKARPGNTYTFPTMTGPLTITSVWDGVDYRERQPETNPASGVLKCADAATLTIGTNTTLTDTILFQEGLQCAFKVPSGLTLTITDTVDIMTKPGNDYYWKIIVDEGGTLVCTHDAMTKLTIENAGSVVDFDTKEVVTELPELVPPETTELTVMTRPTTEPKETTAPKVTTSAEKPSTTVTEAPAASTAPVAEAPAESSNTGLVIGIVVAAVAVVAVVAVILVKKKKK